MNMTLDPEEYRFMFIRITIYYILKTKTRERDNILAVFQTELVKGKNTANSEA